MNSGNDLLQGCILVVDDEAANLKLLDRMLAAQGYAHRVLVQDPREALDAYRACRPSLVLLDINMPHLDGYAVMKRLKALDDPLLPPIVILTAESGREFLLKALAAGAADFIGKPFDRIELSMRVRNLLEANRSRRLLHEQKAVLEEMVAAGTRELNETRLAVIRRLGRAAEFRDNETGNHIVRMSRTSALLAEGLGWTAAQVDLILNASPMHDIGKIAIPDAILLKPGRLDAQERELMKTHAAIGAELLSGDDSPLFVMAREIALTHHERWDGTGYPKGLAGEAIPQSGRICAVTDVFDALASERPYKEAWPVEQALQFIRDGAGSQFDPAVVDVFVRRFDEVLAIRDAARD